MAPVTRAPAGGVWLLAGPDRVRKRERLEIIAQEQAIELLDRHELSADQLSASTLLQFLRAHPAASPLRLVVIDRAQRLDAGCVKVIRDQATQLAQTAWLVLLVDDEVSSTHPLAVLIPHAVIERFTWLTSHELGAWITSYVAHARKEIAPAAVQELVEGGAADLIVLRTLLDQLIAWVGARSTVTVDDLRMFVEPSPSPNQFALVNAIAQRDVNGALRALDEQLAMDREPLEVLGLLIWQLERWLKVAHLAEARVPQERREALTGLKAWQVDRIRGELTGRSVASLREVLRAAWDLDVAAKRGQIPLVRASLERLVVRACGVTSPTASSPVGA